MNAEDFLTQGNSPSALNAEAFLSQGDPTPQTSTVSNFSPAGIAKNAVTSLISLHKGMEDPLDAGAQMLVHAMPESVQTGANNLMGDFAPTASQFDDKLANSENQYQAIRKASGSSGVDWNRMAGNAATTIPLSMMIPTAAPETILGNFGMGAVNGAGYGALQPVTTPGDFANQKLNQMEIGALTGGITQTGANALSRVISPKIAPEVQNLMDSGVTPTPGQIMGGGWKSAEDKLSSVPLVGDLIKSSQQRSIQDFNRAIYNKALEPIGKEVEGNVGREGVEAVKDILSNEYNQLLPKLRFAGDQQFSDELSNLTSMAQEMPKPQFKQFQKIMKNNLLSRLSRQGTMDGETLKGVESVLGQKAKGYLGSSDFDQRQLGSAISEIQKTVRGTLQRSNPQYADQLSKINQGYANYAIIRDAASKVGSENGIFTPAQYLNAVKNADKSVGKGNFATGNARMQDLAEAGKSVLSSKYPDSGTAGRHLMAGLAGLMAGGETGAIMAGHPLAIPAMGAAALPYTKVGQKIMSSALASRPAWAPMASEALNKLAPVAGAGLVPLALSGSE